MSELGHSRPGRARIRSSYVCYAPKSGSQIRVLASAMTPSRQSQRLDGHSQGARGPLAPAMRVSFPGMGTWWSSKGGVVRRWGRAPSECPPRRRRTHGRGSARVAWSKLLLYILAAMPGLLLRPARRETTR
jgi:hypothetical protein